MTDSVITGAPRRQRLAETLHAALAMRPGSPFFFVTPACVLLGFGLLALLLGQSNGWDLRNYHLYDGWAFWTGRGERDSPLRSCKPTTTRCWRRSPICCSPTCRPG